MISITGNWTPIIFLFSILLVGIIVWIIRCLGEKDYKEEKSKTAPFFSGNLVSEGRITGIYWGFFDAMDKYYKIMRKWHSGIVNDYIYWFVLMAVIIMMIMVVG